MITKYYLMNKDNPILSFEISEEGQLQTYQNPKILGILPLDLKNISDWIKSRYVIMERKQSEELMNSLGLTDDKSRIEFTNCSSLFDSFWVKRIDSVLEWKDVSLYKNDYSVFHKIMLY